MPNTKVMITDYGGPEVLKVVTEPDLPVPGPGEVRIRVLATSAAFTDVMIRLGKYPDVRDKPPFTLGYDMVGVVETEGARFPVGTRVADLTTTGAYAEHICRPEAGLTKVPEGVATLDALGAILSGVTPWQMLHRVAKVRAGQRILIHGAGGAVGTMALQFAKLAGVVAYGADIPKKHDLIRELGGIPLAPGAAPETLVDAVFDPLGGESLTRSLHVLAPGGMLVAFGFHEAMLGHGGSISLDFINLTLWDWMPNGHATAFYSIGAMRRKHPNWFRTDPAQVFALLADGKIRAVVTETLPLAEAARAHKRVEAGQVEGKLALIVTEE